MAGINKVSCKFHVTLFGCGVGGDMGQLHSCPPYPSLAPSETEVSCAPNPHPRLKFERVGVLFFSHAAQATPLSSQERVGGAATSPPLVSTPALHQRPQPLRAGSTPPHAASTPPHATSAPPALRDGPMPLPLCAALMPPACAPC